MYDLERLMTECSVCAAGYAVRSLMWKREKSNLLDRNKGTIFGEVGASGTVRQAN